VHRFLGPGFLESIYEEALCIELTLQKIPFARQLAVPLHNKGLLFCENRLDLLVSEELVIELKAVDVLAPIHSTQLLSYLKATGLHLGLLMNFNVAILKNGIKRIIKS
jgi:GxxExxY protein